MTSVSRGGRRQRHVLARRVEKRAVPSPAVTCLARSELNRSSPDIPVTRASRGERPRCSRKRPVDLTNHLSPHRKRDPWIFRIHGNSTNIENFIDFRGVYPNIRRGWEPSSRGGARRRVHLTRFFPSRAASAHPVETGSPAGRHRAWGSGRHLLLSASVFRPACRLSPVRDEARTRVEFPPTPRQMGR